MSMELYVACSTAELPSADEIQSAARIHGSELVVPAIDWQVQSGYCPMVIAGKECGAEVDVFRDEDAIQAVTAFGVPSVKTVVAFRWGGDLTEAACALSMAGAIAARCGGQICDPQEGTVIAVQQVFDDAKSLLAEAE